MFGKLVNEILRSIVLLLISSILFVGFVGYSNASVVSVNNFTTHLSSTIQVPVAIDNAKDVAGFQISISYNKNIVKFIGVSAGSLTAGWSILTNSQTAGQLKIGGFSPSLTPIGDRGGSLFVIRFLSLSAGSSPITLNSAKLSDKNGNSLAVSTKNGIITVTSPTPPPSTYPPTISSFTSSPATGAVPLTVRFTCNASDSDGVIESYSWDFNGDNIIDRTTSTNSVEYTYTREGVYKAKVVVRDNDNMSAQRTLMLVFFPKNGSMTITKDNATHNDIVFITDNGKIENASVVAATGGEQPPDINTTPKKIISIAVDNVSTDSITITAGPFEIDNDTRFYKKVTKDGITKWINLTDNAEKYNFKVNKTTGMITLTIQDNSELDANDETGKIYDPIVLVKSSTQEQSSNQNSQNSSNNSINQNSNNTSGGGGGGCTIDQNAGFDITLPLLLIILIVIFLINSQKHTTKK